MRKIDFKKRQIIGLSAACVIAVWLMLAVAAGKRKEKFPYANIVRN